MLDRFRVEHPQYREDRLTYAGRLDPLAEGLVILLSGDDLHRKNDYVSLDKDYEVTFIIGCATDTYDALGIAGDFVPFQVSVEDLRHQIVNMIGPMQQAYPPYSSKVVDGKSLWQWAREGIEVDSPQHDIEIKEATLIEYSSIAVRDVLSDIESAIDLVSGDFRQEEVLMPWRQTLSALSADTQIPLCRAQFTVSSGTYVRGLIHDLGQSLGPGATCLTITRTRVGQYIDK